MKRNRHRTLTAFLIVIAASPTTSQGTIHVIPANGAQGFGHSVSGAGDLDGDGVQDLLSGAPFDSTVAPSAGRIAGFSGASGALIFDSFGFGSGDNFGNSVAALGDVDGDGSGDIDADGVQDWCVGSPPHERVTHGKIRVYSGRSMSVLFEFTGQFMGGVAGGAGDVDGDGYGDLLVGVPGDSTFGTNNGRVDVRSGATGALIHQVYGPGYSLLGSAVDGPGDVNGDGLDDFLVAAERAEEPGNGLEDAGAVHLFSGADASILFTRWGEEPTANFGFGLAALGDVDADSVADFVVTSPGLDHTSVAGEITVVSGTCGGTTHYEYCVGAVNSTGLGAAIGFRGSTSVSADDLVLTVEHCPVNKPGLFFFGQLRGFTAFGDGFLCTMPPYIRVYPVLFTDTLGRASRDIDFQHPPWTVFLLPDSTPNFQFWYRDPHGPGGTGTNTSNALGLVLCR